MESIPRKPSLYFQMNQIVELLIFNLSLIFLYFKLGSGPVVKSTRTPLGVQASPIRNRLRVIFSAVFIERFLDGTIRILLFEFPH